MGSNGTGYGYISYWRFSVVRRSGLPDTVTMTVYTHALPTLEDCLIQDGLFGQFALSDDERETNPIERVLKAECVRAVPRQPSITITEEKAEGVKGASSERN